MRSRHITSIATTIIAITLILGTIFYFKEESNNKKQKEEKFEQIKLKDGVKKLIDEEKGWFEIIKKGKDKQRMDKIYKLYKLDKKACKSASYDYDDFFKCMSEKGYREKFIKRFYYH